MSDHAAVHDSHGHGAHWDTSIWPLVIAFGILFFLPLSFSLHFVYHKPMLAIIALGIGAPMIIAGAAGWTSEAIGGGEGLSRGAMGWFILAEAMIFMSFFANYWFTRLTAPAWPPAGTPAIPQVMPLIMTVTLVSSSFTAHFAEAALEHSNRSKFVQWWFASIVLGAAFVSMSAFEWHHLMGEGFTFGTNIYSTSFFSITGFHGAHVILGLCGFIAVLLPALRGLVNDGFVKTVSLYWHFVDIIWLFVVSQVYFW